MNRSVRSSRLRRWGTAAVSGPPPRAPRTAFVLSGGGNLGALQVGMLRALVERHVHPELVVGCSVGAINGVGFASDPGRRGVRRLQELWAKVPAFDIMPSTWVPSTVQLARRGASIHANDGLRRLIEHGLTFRTFEELPLPFQCVATDIDSAEEVWFERGDLAEAILASSALPTVFPPVPIGPRRFLDGGIVNDIPLTRALELGAERIYVLHVGLRGTVLPEPRRPLDVALWTYWLARRARYQRDRATIPSGIELIELAPSERPAVRFDDFTRSEELVRQGYELACRRLDRTDPVELPAAVELSGPLDALPGAELDAAPGDVASSPPEGGGRNAAGGRARS